MGVDLLPVADDLARQLDAWTRWLERERRLSAHTVRAYVADVRRFLTFLAGHAGGPVGIARLAATELSTSSPSNRPEILVVPLASPPKRTERCEMDLSPGTATLPDRDFALLAIIGVCGP